MLWPEERRLICAYGKKLLQSGLTRGTGGNLSLCSREENRLFISPSGMDYSAIDAADVVVLDLQGNLVDGRQPPSTEVPLHLAIYHGRPDINALVHTHSPFATTLACLGWGLPPIHYLVTIAGPDVRCAPYAPFGSTELGARALEAMDGRKAVLLAHHGLLAGDADLASAFRIAEQIEFCAELYWRARSLAETPLLTSEQVDQAMGQMGEYGRRPPGLTGKNSGEDRG